MRIHKPYKKGWKHKEETKRLLSSQKVLLYQIHPEKSFFVSNPTIGIKNTSYIEGLEKFRTKEWLYEQYKTKNRTVKSIASEVGVTVGCIRKWLLKSKITLRTPLEWGALKKGNKNGNWRNGATQNYKCGRSCKGWRIEVLKRDKYKCVLCGSDKQIEVDHIKPWVDFPELRTEISNGRTLCKQCHKKITYSYLSIRFKKK